MQKITQGIRTRDASQQASAAKKPAEVAAADPKKGPAAAEQTATNLPSATKASTAVAAAMNFREDAGQGMEGVDKDSFAIPFLVVLQPLSPVVVDELVPGAKAGMLMNSVTQELYGAEAFFVPCAYQRRFIRWGAREKGGGFKGEFSVADAADIRTKGEVKELENKLYYPAENGDINPKTCDKLSDTRNHFGILMRSATDNFGSPIIFSLASSGIKVSKNFMSRIDAIKLKDEHDNTYTPPSFSHIYRITVEKKTNEKGTWFQPVVGMVGPVTDPLIYNAGKSFHRQVISGTITIAHDSLERSGGGGGVDDNVAF